MFVASAGLHFSRIADADRCEVGTENLRHDPDARKIGHGETRRGAGRQQFAGRNKLFHHGSSDGRIYPAAKTRNRPALLKIFDGLRIKIQ